jgi:hypothetical protein
MSRLAVLALLALAACGADGAPQAPASGVSISGTARAGIVQEVVPK